MQTNTADFRKSWRTVKLKDIAKINPDTASFGKNIPDDFVYIDIGSIKNFSVRSPQIIAKGEKIPSRAQRKVAADDILVSTVRPNLRNIAKVPETYDSQICSTGFSVLRADKEIASQEYLFQLVKSDDFTNYLVAKTLGSNYPAVNSSEVGDYNFQLPPLDDQIKIAAILKKVDEALELCDQAIIQLNTLKKALLQKSFRDHGWGTSKLGDLLECIIDHRGKTPKKMGSDWSPTGIPAISAMNIKNNHVIKPDTFKYVDENLYHRWMKQELETGDLLLTSEAPMGEMYLVKDGDKFCLSQRVFGLRLKSQVLPEFIYYYLSSGAGKTELFTRKSGSTAQGIRQSELVKVKIPVPESSVQQEIVKMLQLVDENIDINAAHRSQLVIVKNGLSRDLLSGKVRA